jgi:transcriptional regulator of acetoin/glycerol metabolism
MIWLTPRRKVWSAWTVMDDWTRSMERARESMLSPGPARRDEADRPSPVRPVVYESWRRSTLYGLDPCRVAPTEQRDMETDTYLVRAAEPVVRAREAALEQTLCALSLIDQEGRLLRRWVPDAGMRRLMDAHHVTPGFSVAEPVVGTTSAVSLLSGAPLLVDGPEHFSERFRALSCASAPVVHPVTRRTVGSINLTCRYTDSSPLLLAWVTELAAGVRAALHAGASRRERLLFDSYLSNNHDTRHPLVALDDQMIITNAAAVRLLGGVDQGLLWEHARAATSSGVTGPVSVVLSDGTSVRIECVPVRDGADPVGAVLTLKPATAHEPDARVARPVPVPAPCPLPGLVGVGPAWRTLCRRAAGLDASRVLVVGERGAGKLAVARAVSGMRGDGGEARVLDAAAAGPTWEADLETALSDPAAVPVLRHLDALDERRAAATRARLERHPSGAGPVLATASVEPSGALLDHFDAVLEVPPLRERPEDLPALLESITARLVGSAAPPGSAGPPGSGRGCGAPVRWMPDAVQTLARIDWPANLTSLEACVRRVLAGAHGGYVGATALPADLVARASRRPLARLEQAEARAILTALREAGGNKHRAAESLGIARSTLYRKVRALGIDLSTSMY